MRIEWLITGGVLAALILSVQPVLAQVPPTDTPTITPTPTAWPPGAFAVTLIYVYATDTPPFTATPGPSPTPTETPTPAPLLSMPVSAGGAYTGALDLSGTLGDALTIMLLAMLITSKLFGWILRLRRR